MKSFKMDHKYFQRGQTWPECLTSWQHERVDMLTRVQDAATLPGFSAWLQTLPQGTRFALVYDAYLADTCKLLPTLAHTLEQAPNLICRYFDHDYFFPDLHPTLGRRLPCLVPLDHEGVLQAPWGPRPEQVTRELAATGGTDAKQRLAWLLAYEQERYERLLDDDLLAFTRQWHIFN